MLNFFFFLIIFNDHFQSYILLIQISLFLLLCVPAALSSMSIFIFQFAASTPAHKCVGPSNHTLNNSITWNDDLDLYSSCSHPIDSSSTLPCSVWVFDDSIFSSTAVEDFSMVCQNSWQKSTAQVRLTNIGISIH